MNGGKVASVSARVEELLQDLGQGAFGAAAPAARELVSLVVGLYGDGLERIVGVLRERGPDGAAVLSELADDELVEGLLLLHGLHPLDAGARIQRALDRVRPYLGSHAGGIEYLGVENGVARLRLAGSCHGCPSSAVTVQLAITGAVRDAAPEVEEVVVEGVTPPPAREPALLQIGSRPGGPAADESPVPGSEAAPYQGAARWVPLPDIGPPSARPVSASADGVAVVVCAVRGTLYAYRDECPGCGKSLAAGDLDTEILTCTACTAAYNVRLAGLAVGESDRHLDPLPLLADGFGVRVAIPEVVA